MGYLDGGILTRAKKGFPVPLTRWLRADLYEPCRERLLSARSRSREIFGARALARLLEEHRRGAADRREELFALWVFEEWHEAFLGRGAEERARSRTRPTAELSAAAAT